MNIFDLIINDREKVSFDDILLHEESRKSIYQLIKEHKHVAALQEYGLPVNNKILLHGHSGCGKTMTAKAIANAMQKNIFILNLSNVVSSKIGETSQNLKQVFDKAAREKAVLFLDEFDLIAKARGNDDKDVGEMRRLVNTVIQLVDYFPADAVLLAATNHLEIIDTALIRRFQLQIAYEMPSSTDLHLYYNKLVAPFPEHLRKINHKMGISYAEAKDHALTQVKSLLLYELEKNPTI